MNADGDRGAGEATGPAPLSATQAEELDQACDRFEAEWRAGKRPRIEDHFGAAAEPLRAALLGGLIAVEVDRRRRLGEHPDPAEYRGRFPAHASAVTAAFGPSDGRVRPTPVAPRTPGPAAGLLLGLLAFQNRFLDRPALLAALDDWIADKTRPLGRILLDRGALDPATFALLEALANKHLEAHGGDPRESLAALSSIDPLRDDLARIADAEVQASVMHLTATTTHGQPAGRTTTLGESTSGGGRFRVLRPHARGGLGEVFVARDTELNREVALKEIQDRFADDPRHRARFEFEAEITGSLEHPGIVPVYGLGHTPDGRPFYAMRFIRGDSLKEAIGRFHEAEAQPGRTAGQARPGVARTAGSVPRRLRRDRLCPQPRRPASRPEAGEHHAGPVRRDAGRRLGTGQGRRSAGGAAGGPHRTAAATVIGQPARSDTGGLGAGDAGVYEPGAGRRAIGSARGARATSTAWVQRSITC